MSERRLSDEDLDLGIDALIMSRDYGIDEVCRAAQLAFDELRHLRRLLSEHREGLFCAKNAVAATEPHSVDEASGKGIALLALTALLDAGKEKP